MPTRSPSSRTSRSTRWPGSTPYLRDGGGNVITVSRQSLGSTDTNEMFVDISGVTVTAGNTCAEAGIAFFGAAGRVSESVVGPMKVATTAGELADNPHGWGIVKTGVIQGAGAGHRRDRGHRREQRGHRLPVRRHPVRRRPGRRRRCRTTSCAPASSSTATSTDTVVKGRPNALFPQTGVKYTSGADGFVRNSRITGNYFRPDPSKSYGILLTDAGTETSGALTASGSIITGNGFAVYNANADKHRRPRGAPSFIVQPASSARASRSRAVRPTRARAQRPSRDRTPPMRPP